MLRAGVAFVALPTAILHLNAASVVSQPMHHSGSSANRLAKTNDRKPEGDSMKIQYLETVTPEVDAVCSNYAALHGIEFGDGDPGLGGARTATMADGGMIGVRAPMHDAEEPVIRPYTLVEDIERAVFIAAEAGVEVAVPPMALPGHGNCTILLLGGTQTGLWES